MIENKKKDILNILYLYVLPVGILVFLFGMFFLSSRNEFKTLFYCLLMTPVIITILLDWQLLKVINLSPILQAAIVFLFFATLSVFWSDGDRSFFHYLKRMAYIFTFIMSFVCIYTYSPERFIRIIFIGCIGAAFFSFYFLIKFYILDGAQWHHRITGEGVLYNPLLSAHVFGFYMAIIFSFLLQLKLNMQTKMILVLALAPIALFLVMTHARTPLLAFFSMLFVYLLIEKSKGAVYLLIGIVIVYLAIYLIYPHQFMRSGFSERPQIWTYAFGEYIKSPLLGIGVNSNFSIPFTTGEGGAYADAHNIHLTVLLRTGIIGFCLWVFMYWKIFKGMILDTSSELSKAFFLVIIYGAVSALTEGGAFFSRPKEHWFIIWLPIALCVAVEAGTELRHKCFHQA